MATTPPHRVSVRRGAAAAAGLLALGVALVACGGDEGGNTAAFCGRVDDNRERLFGDLPAPLTPQGAAEYLDLINRVGAVAPLEIEADWDAWAHTVETFVTSTDREELLATAYAFQESALTINDWLQANCGFDIGVPIGTLAPLGAATTIAPALPVDTATGTAPPG